MNHRVSGFLFWVVFLWSGCNTAAYAIESKIQFPDGNTSSRSYLYIVRERDSLYVDLYLPTDYLPTKRPLILFVHGGGFSAGTRSGNDIVNFARTFSRQGYSVGSISYRLTRKDEPTGFGCECPASDKLDTFAAAVEDINDALIFLAENAGDWNLDMQKVILAGSSAGAEAILMLAYGNFLPDVGARPYKIAGLIGLAGAITNLHSITPVSAVPTLLFHGTCDNLVPFATASHHHCAPDKPGHLILHGSQSIAQRLTELNVAHWLHVTCGGGHELAGTPLSQYLDVISEFTSAFVLEKVEEFRLTIVPGDDSSCLYGQFPVCNP